MQRNISGQNGSDNTVYGHYIIYETCSDLRTRARTMLSGKWKTVALTVFIFLVLVYTVPGIFDLFFGKERVVDLSQYADSLKNMKFTVKESPVTNIYTFLVVPPLTYGITMYFLDIARHNACAPGDIFQGFEKFLKTVLLALYMYIFILLWALIPIAGVFLAIRAAIRYSLSYCIMCDYPEMSVPLCVEESKRLMEGNKMKYLLLNLSFIGWFALTVVAVAVCAFVVSMLFIPILDTANGNALVTLIATTIGMGFTAFVVAYTEAATIEFYELTAGKINGEVSFVRDM